MRKIVALMVVVSFVTASSSFAAGPIEESGKRAASELARQSTASNASNGRTMLWSGLGLIAGGVGLMAIATGPAKKSECKDILSGSRVIGRECEESSNAALGWSGLGLALFGTTLTIASFVNDVQIRRNSIALSLKF